MIFFPVTLRTRTLPFILIYLYYVYVCVVMSSLVKLLFKMLLDMLMKGKTLV